MGEEESVSLMDMAHGPKGCPCSSRWSHTHAHTGSTKQTWRERERENIHDAGREKWGGEDRRGIEGRERMLQVTVHPMHTEDSQILKKRWEARMEF